MEEVKVTPGGLVIELSTRDDDDDNWVVPRLLRWVYQMESYVPVATHRNMLGVIGFFDDSPSQEGQIDVVHERMLH